MPKASETGDKPAKAVKTKVKPEKTGKAKPAVEPKAAQAAKPGAADRPAVVKPTATRRAAPKRPVKKTGGEGVPVLPEEQRRHYIEVAAYYIAERRGFCGSQLEDWVQAEAEIDRLLREGILRP